MTSWTYSCLRWLRQMLGGDSSWISWRAGLAFVLLAICASILAIGVRGQGLTAQVLLGGIFLVVAAFIGRGGWLGPILFYDLVQISRRHRYRIIRVAYACFLLGLLGWIYTLRIHDLGWIHHSLWSLHHERNAGQLATEMARFAASFFYPFMLVQAILVTVLTPVYTAGIITDEKERHTLDLLLTTDLRNREIVLGKMVSRLFQIVLLMLTGLPILSFLQFLGGIDPNLVLSGFAATGLTALSLAGLSIFFSTLLQRSRNAIVATYLTAAGYLLLSGSLWLSVAPPSTLGNWPSTAAWTSPVTVQDVVEWVNAGNPVIAWYQLMEGVQRLRAVDTLLLELLRPYALFHIVVALGGLFWAMVRLRGIARGEADKNTDQAAARMRWRFRPAIGQWPMIWKEVWVETRFRFPWLVRFAIATLAIVIFVHLVYFVNENFSSPLSFLLFPLAVRGWVQSVSSLISCLLLLAVGVRAAGAISGERHRQTFDDLLTTPLTAREILAAKWLGSIVSVRWGWAWLGLIWFVGVLGGILSIYGVFLHIMVWFLYAAVAALIGLYCSLVCRTSLRATIWSLIWLLFLGGGHWLVMWFLCYLPLEALHVPARSYQWMSHLEIALTPPKMLAFVTLSESDFYSSFYNQIFPGLDSSETLMYCLFGGLCWCVLAAILWQVTCRRFRMMTGRSLVSRLRLRHAMNATPLDDTTVLMLSTSMKATVIGEGHPVISLDDE